MTQEQVEAAMDAISRERISIQAAAYRTSIKPDRAALLERAEAKQAEWMAMYELWIPPHQRATT